MKVEISNLVIKVNKKKLSLNLNEAKALFDKLNDIFGPKYNYTPSWMYSNGTNTITSSDNVTLRQIDNSNVENIEINNLTTLKGV